MIFFVILFTFFYTTNAQEIDFLSILNDSASSENFLLQRPGRTSLNTTNESINIKRYESALKHENDRLLTVAANNLGMIYLKNNDPTKAITYFKKSQEASERLKNDKANSAAQIELGLAYQQIKDYKKAIVYYTNSAKLLEPLNQPKLSGLVYALLGQCYNLLRDFPIAIESFNRAGKAYSTAGEKSQTATCLNYIGELQLKIEDYKKALSAFNSARTLINPSDLQEIKLHSIILRNIGLVSFKQGKFETAVEYFNKSLALNNQLIVQKLVKDSYLQLFTLYGFQNDFNKADYFHDKYRNLKDSIDNLDQNTRISKVQEAVAEEEKQQIIDLLQKKYQEQELQMNQKQLELSKMITKTDIELQNKDQQLVQKDSVVQHLTNENIKRERDLAKKELQINKQNSFRNLLIAITIGILLTTLLLFNRYLLKRNSNRTLTKTNNELEDTLEKLKQTQAQLVHSEKMASLGQLTAGIAHEIQNPLNFVNNFSESGIEIINDLKTETNPTEQIKLYDELTLTLDKIHQHGKRADKIVKNMLLHSRSGTINKESIDLIKLCDEMLDLAYRGARTRFPGFHCSIEKTQDDTIPPISINSQDIGRVLVNIFTNGFYAIHKKFNSNSDGSPQLRITTLIIENQICIKIRDNGNGIPNEIKEHIFEPFFTTKPAGEGTGLGLSLSFDIISKGHGGTIEVESELNEFTEFRIYLPLKA